MSSCVLVVYSFAIQEPVDCTRYIMIWEVQFLMIWEVHVEGNLKFLMIWEVHVEGNLNELFVDY
jgi:hypothetical protein